MFPKSNIIHDPFSYTSHELLKQSYNTHDHHFQNPNPSSTIVVVVEEDHPFFLNFPSPVLDDHELPLSQIFSLKHHQELEASDNHGIDQAEPASKKRKLSAKPRRRTGKKDRHSKICTAQGVRDRRMRLSLQIARKFFDLQDMLGFDKASKTIEWLFSKSKNAIKELSRNIPQDNNSSENNDDRRKLRKIESRDRPIREKAREKIVIKLGHNKKCNQELDETNPKSIDKLGSNSQYLEHQFANVGIMERYLGGASCSSITSVFDYDNNGVIKGGIDICDNCFNMGFLENCTMTNEV